jgi:hypothetical protein
MKASYSLSADGYALGISLFSVVVLDQNLVQVCENHFDGSMNAWTCLELNGIEYLALTLKSARLVLLQMPLLRSVFLDVKLPSLCPSIVFVKSEQTVYLVTTEHRVLTVPARPRD